jgi:hypothetical protein
MRRFFSPSIVGNGILWLVGLAMQIGGWVSHTIAYILLAIAAIWSLCSVVYWRKNKGKKQPEIVKETKADSLTNILTDMHKRMWHLKSERLRQHFDKKMFEDGAPLLFDKLGLVELRDWDIFERKLKRRLRQRIPKSPEKRRSMVWRYRLVSEAKKVIDELVSSRQWGIPDAVKAGEHLDSLHMGLRELHDQDKQWSDLFERTKPYIIDSVLRGLIDEYISCSYAFCSMSLGIDYSSRLPKNGTTRLLYSALVGSNISPSKIDIALSEILEKIANRIKEPLKLIDSFPKDNDTITLEDVKNIFLKFNKPIDRETEGLIGNYAVKADTWCQWNIGGWIQHDENDTKLIWHIKGDPQKNKDWFGPMETDYPIFEIRIPNSSQSPGLRATDGSELPRTIIRVKIRAESRILTNRDELLRTIAEARIATIEFVESVENLKEHDKQSPNLINTDICAAVDKAQQRQKSALETMEKEILVAGSDYESILKPLYLFMQSSAILNASPTTNQGTILTYKYKLEEIITQTRNKIDELSQPVS